MGSLAHGDGPTLQDAADDLVQRLLTYVLALAMPDGTPLPEAYAVAVDADRIHG